MVAKIGRIFLKTVFWALVLLIVLLLVFDRLVQFRIYSLDHRHDAMLSRAAATVLNKTPSSIESNY